MATRQNRLDSADSESFTPWPGGGGDSKIAEVSFKARSGGIRLTTEPFLKETEITGPVALRLYVSSSTSDADIFATLNLLTPTGEEVLFASASDPHAPV